MSSNLEYEYKVVIAIKDVTSEKSIKNDLACKISIADQQFINKIPFKEAITLDVKDLQKYNYCDIQFENQIRVFGRVRITIPTSIETKNEIEIEESFCLKTETDEKKTLELKGKYLLVILNKKFFNKKKTQESPKTITQTEYIPEKKPIVNEKKKISSNKPYVSSSPSTSKSLKKDVANSTKLEETLQTHSEKLDNSDNMRNSEVLRSDMNKTESIIKKEIMKSETLNTETSKSENKKPENSDLVKVETKKFEETELIYTTRSPKLTSNPILEKNKLKKPQPKSKKTKKNKEMLDNLIERAYETQTVEKKFIDDMEKIDECVYLTKLKNSEENKDKTGQDSDNGDSARIKKILNSSSDFNREYRENLDISPESLSKKFDQVEEKNLNSSSDIRKMNKTKPNEKKRFYSPNASFKNNSVAVDNTEGVLLENDVQKYLQSYESQINYLKVMVYALDKKLADYNSIKKENELLKMELKKDENSRRELHGTIKETTDEMKTEILNIHSNYNKALAEKNEYIDKLKKYEKKFSETIDMNEKIENSKRKLEDDINENLIKLRGFNELKAQAEINKIQLLNSEKKQIEMQNAFADKLKEISSYAQSLENQNKDLSNEKNDLKKEIMELKHSLAVSSNTILERNSEIDSLKRKIQINQGYDIIIKNLNDQINNLTRQLESKKNEIEEAFNFADGLKTEMTNLQKNVSTREKKLQDQNFFLEKQFIQQDTKINNLNDLITNLQSKNSEIKTNLSTLEQFVCLKEDLRKKLDFSNEKVDNLTRDKESLFNKVQELSDELIHHDNKLLDMSTIVSQLKDYLAQKENYCNNLRKLILEMREKGGYVPFKDDPVDNKLADYINSANFKDNNLKILFIREGEGVYQFGTKRVFVTIHQEKINIRVGGGFMKIEDFVDSYIPLELEKLKRKDPVKIFNTNLAVNKTIAGRMVHEFEKMHTSEFKPEKFNNVFRLVKKTD